MILELLLGFKCLYFINWLVFWEFEAKGSWDEGKGSWVFWNNKDTVIVTSSQNENVYDRYIITNQDDENLNTILEIIQRN